MNEYHPLDYGVSKHATTHASLSILAFCAALAFLALAAFVHIYEEGRDWAFWMCCRDFGWAIGLLALFLAGMGFGRPGKHVFSGIAIVVTVPAFVWYATPVIFR